MRQEKYEHRGTGLRSLTPNAKKMAEQEARITTLARLAMELDAAAGNPIQMTRIVAEYEALGAHNTAARIRSDVARLKGKA